MRFWLPYNSPRQRVRKVSIQEGNTNESNYFKNPLHLARGPLGLWYCKIDLLTQTLMNILNIVMKADEPKTLYTNLCQPQLQ